MKALITQGSPCCVQGNGLQLHIVAHSMGSYALGRILLCGLQAYKTQDLERSSRCIQSITFAAADARRDEIQFIVDKLTGQFLSQAQMTLFCSRDDNALAYSNALRNWKRASYRAGLIHCHRNISGFLMALRHDSDLHAMAVPRLEVVDATPVNVGLLGHSYFLDSPEMVNLLASIIIGGQSARSWNLRKSSCPKCANAGCWEMHKGWVPRAAHMQAEE